MSINFKNISPNNKENIFLLFLNLSFYGIFIFNNGHFWDDWTFSDQSFETLKLFFIKSSATGGHPFATYVHYFITRISSNSIFSIGTLFHFCTFLCHLFSTFVLKNILYKSKFDNVTSFVITIIFIISPYNFAKIYNVILPYTIGNLFLLLSILFYIKLITEKSNAFIFIIWVVTLFFSFQLLNSSFFFLPIVYFLLLFNFDKISFKNIFKIIFITILFWEYKILFNAPIAEWQNYNKITIDGILNIPLNLFRTILHSILYLPKYIYQTLSISPFIIFLILIFTILFSLYYRHKNLVRNSFQFSLKKLNFKSNIFIGVILFIAGSIPYNIVKHVPQFNFPISRDQILINYGIIFMIAEMYFYVINLIKNELMKIRMSIILFSLFSSFLFTTNILNAIDTLKVNHIQRALQFNFNKILSYNHEENLVFHDDFKSKFWNESVRFYVFSGIVYKFDKSQKILILPESEYINFNKYSFSKLKNQENKILYVNLNKKFTRIIHASFKKNKFEYFDILKLTFYQYFNRKRYLTEVNNLLYIKTFYIKY
jgi:hypothetical protein